MENDDKKSNNFPKDWVKNMTEEFKKAISSDERVIDEYQKLLKSGNLKEAEKIKKNHPDINFG